MLVILKSEARVLMPVLAANFDKHKSYNQSKITISQVLERTLAIMIAFLKTFKVTLVFIRMIYHRITLQRCRVKEAFRQKMRNLNSPCH